MKKHYETMEIKIEILFSQDVLTASAPIGDNNDETIGDIYDLL